MTTQEILQAAQTARMPLALADADTKNAALEAMAVALIAAKDAILDANAKDLAAARGRVSDVMLDRLALTPSRLTDMAKGMREVAALPDPVGAVLRRIVRPNGLVIEKTAVPMGVIAIIYESRPNVTSDAAALAVKAGSACILRCGRDAWASCHAIVEALRAGLRKARLPECAVSVAASVTNNNALAVSNAVGSNIFNLMVVCGICALIVPLTVQIETLKKEFPFSVFCALLLLVLGYWDRGDTWAPGSGQCRSRPQSRPHGRRRQPWHGPPSCCA